MLNRVKWVISFYLKGFFPSTDDGKRAGKMINRLEADCEERLKELWIFAWSQKADMQLITVFKLMKQYFMGDREQLCFLFQEQEDLMLQKTDWIQSENFEQGSLGMKQISTEEDHGFLIVNKHLHVELHGTQLQFQPVAHSKH